jgi:hypothetical protein
MWITTLDWNGSNWLVYLSRDGRTVATMTLDDWAALSATEYLIENNHPAPQSRPSRHQAPAAGPCRE